MIHPRAVKEFMRAERDTFAWVKDLPEKQLDRELEKLGFSPARRKKPLRKHQKVCVLIGLAYMYFSFWLDMGTGKTRIILEMLQFFYDQEFFERGIVLVPSEPAVYSWEEQIAEWQIKVPYVCLPNGPSAEKWKAVDDLQSGLIIATYPGLTRMVSTKVPGKGKKKPRLKWNRKLMQRFTANLGVLILDESTNVGNQGSLIYRICRKLSQTCRYRYALAGRPFGRDAEMVWSQQFLVDHGESLGDTLGLFRAALFSEKQKYFGGFEYTLKPAMKEVLADLLQHRGIAYASSECQDLPRVARIPEYIDLPETADLYYKKAVRAIIAARGHHAQIRNIFLRMRQLSSGFLGYKDDETGERAQLVFPENPKLDRLLELVDEMPLDRKFVIFYEFTHSGRTISKALSKMGIETGWLWSGTKNYKQVKRRFDDDPKVRGVIVNNRLGTKVLNLQAANYKFFYESPVGVIDREQAEKRAFREGQKRPGFMYDLIAKGTADQKILDFHASGEGLFKALLRDPYGIFA